MFTNLTCLTAGNTAPKLLLSYCCPVIKRPISPNGRTLKSHPELPMFSSSPYSLRISTELYCKFLYRIFKFFRQIYRKRQRRKNTIRWYYVFTFSSYPANDEQAPLQKTLALDSFSGCALSLTFERPDSVSHHKCMS